MTHDVVFVLQVLNRCCQLLTSIFQAAPTIAVPYIQALGPRLLLLLQVRVTAAAAAAGNVTAEPNIMLLLQAVERRRPESADELAGVLEGVRAFKAMIQAADQNQRKSTRSATLKVHCTPCSETTVQC